MSEDADGLKHAPIPIWSELVARTNWFIGLRWLAVVVMVLAALVARYAFEFQNISYPAIYILAGCLLLSNASYWLAARVLTRRGSVQAGIRWAFIFFNVQISIDLLILTVLVHYTGGYTNPFVFFYVFHVIFASILLSRGAAFGQASLASVLFISMMLLEHNGYTGSYILDETTGRSSIRYMVVMVIAFVSMLFVAAYLATSIMDKLRHRERELDRTWREVRALEAAKTQLMQVVAHELRSPSAAVESILRALLITYGPKMDEHAMKLVERSINRVQSLTKLVNDLLVFSRQQALEASTGGEFTRFDLHGVVSETVDVFKPQATEKNITLNTDLEEVRQFTGDRESIEQLLNNLISNAIRYTPEGGSVDVTLRGRNDAAAPDSAGTVALSVADTGIGIPEKDVARIFEEFHRSGNARKFAPIGTGLGLAIAKAVVDRHGGSISVDSTEGSGTTFHIKLPLNHQRT